MPININSVYTTKKWEKIQNNNWGCVFVWGWGGIKRSQPFHEISSLHKKLIAQFSKMVVLNLIFQIKVGFFNWFEFHLRNHQSVFFFQNIHFLSSSSCSCCSCGWSSKKCWSAPITSWKMMSSSHQRIKLRLVSVIAIVYCWVIMIGSHRRSSWSSSVWTKSEEICHFSARHLGFESTCEPSVFGFCCQFAISRLNVFFFQCDGTSNL